MKTKFKNNKKTTTNTTYLHSPCKKENKFKVEKQCIHVYARVCEWVNKLLIMCFVWLFYIQIVIIIVVHLWKESVDQPTTAMRRDAMDFYFFPYFHVRPMSNIPMASAERNSLHLSLSLFSSSFPKHIVFFCSLTEFSLFSYQCQCWQQRSLFPSPSIYCIISVCGFCCCFFFSLLLFCRRTNEFYSNFYSRHWALVSVCAFCILIIIKYSGILNFILRIVATKSNWGEPMTGLRE